MQFDDCVFPAECDNFDGGFDCICAPGYFGTYNNCSDVNECDENIFTCPLNSACNNTIGSYNCACDLGYEENNGQCDDIDECNVGHDCDTDSGNRWDIFLYDSP